MMGLGLCCSDLGDVGRFFEAIEPDFDQVALPGGVEHVRERHATRILGNRDANHGGLPIRIQQCLRLHASLAERPTGCNYLSGKSARRG